MITDEYYIPDDGIRLHIKLDRPDGFLKGPLMILLHGLTGHMEERHILAVRDTSLEAGFAVLRADMYGHGKSGGAFRDHTIFKWLTNVMTVTDHAKTLDFATDLYLMGHSQGGYTAMLAAGMRPDAYRAVIPLSPAIVIEDGAKKGKALGIAFDPARVPDDFRQGAWPLSGNYIRAMQMVSADGAIEKYHKPVCIIHGDADETVPVRYSIDAAARYENCRLCVIPGDTHCYDHHLDKVQEALKAFLSEQAGKHPVYGARL
ncbi:MAG: alpha/beta fold hydrolase [Lachnospiraceae bacterium]|nr:alpha/beta fold hydrolase [Lachnospiraceae bacterium]